MDVKYKNMLPQWESRFFDTREYLGFVYMIKNIKTGRFYIGQKKLWKSPKPPICYKKRKVKPSDWKSYWSSCNDLNKELEKNGTKDFERTIISVHKNKWDMSYRELIEQINHRVLDKDTNTYNKYIGCRLRKRR